MKKKPVTGADFAKARAILGPDVTDEEMRAIAAWDVDAALHVLWRAPCKNMAVMELKPAFDALGFSLGAIEGEMLYRETEADEMREADGRCRCILRLC